MAIDRSKTLDIDSVLDSILQGVVKPGRYIGNEIHAVRKNGKEVDVSFALFFPDVYELGMSYLGFQILYHILNAQDFVAAERVFSPWPDFEKRLRQYRIPLFSLESKKPVCSFDIVGFTLQYELHATNIVNGLDLSGIPVVAAARREADPIVIAGGPNAANPEPLADFFDAVVLGDGEGAVLEIARVLQQRKVRHWSRLETLKHLSELEGVYIPGFFHPKYDVRGNFIGILSKASSGRRRVKGRIEALRECNYPPQPVVPLIRTTHNRLNIEVMRGCTRGCRFCHAGYYYRPSRERSAKDVAEYVRETIQHTGNEEISLVSLSTSDYQQLPSLWEELKDFIKAHHLSIALPSLRPETITPELLQLLQSEKKSGLTLAPEAGTQRLRNVINKTLDEEEIFQAVGTAFQYGWKLVKLYFMIGLPTEREEDLIGLTRLVNRIGKMARNYGARVKISLSLFTPKPHTPFQWVSQDSIAQMEAKIRLVKKRIRGKNIELKWRNPEVTRLEGILARGDRRLGRVIYKAWQLGARFDAWSDHFSWPLWQEAFQDTAIDPDVYTRARDRTESLPWDHLRRGVTRKFLRQEWGMALKERVVEDCKFTACNFCGLMFDPGCQEILNREKKGKAPPGRHPVFRWPREADTSYPSERRKEVLLHCRIKYSKYGLLKYIGHLDLVHLLQRVLRIARVPVVFSQGYSPHPRMAFAPPLPLGMESFSEYFDMQLFQNPNFDLKRRLNSLFPEGLRVLEIAYQSEKFPPFESFIACVEYLVAFDSSVSLEFALTQYEAADSIWFERKTRRTSFPENLKKFVEKIHQQPDGSSLRIRLRVEKGRTVKVKDVLTYGLRLPLPVIARAKITREYMGPAPE